VLIVDLQSLTAMLALPSQARRELRPICSVHHHQVAVLAA